MCGISGIVAPDARKYRGNLEAMTNALRHRGPDGSGTLYFPECALGHTRLSIIDLSTGQQPMSSASAPVAVTFNGEIYGYRSIRDSLAEEYPFRTTSDTEVLLALYLRHGVRFVEKLPGMFSFALWDAARKELVCARDRFGEKPFFYALGNGGEFLFASEIKAILETGLIRPVLDTESVAHYLNHLYVHPGRTIYRNVYTLPPAHFLVYRNGRAAVERYWSLPEPREEIALPDAVEEFRRLFDRAVSRQLVADVPVGSFLSGGLDSTTVVAVASRHRPGIETYSFGFEDSASELPYAREVARRYGTRHIELGDSGADVGELLVGMAGVYDEPFADSSSIPMYLISMLARRHVKVVLTGDGGDELLAGYDYWYRPLLQMEEAPHPSLWREALLRTVAGVSKSLGLRSAEAWEKRRRGMSYRRRFGSIEAAHAAQNAFFGDRELAALGVNPRTRAGGRTEGGAPSGTVDDALRMDLQDYMPGDILVKTDRASMAHGLELRAPFLDVEFASFCISLPSRMKITPESDKRILREAFAESWPPSVRSRGKQGFGAPVGQWLKRPSMRSLKARYLDDPAQRIFSILPFERTREAASRDDYRTWALLVLALWLDRTPCELPAGD
jgi:asparagine synthase (glutamine-hydrolysing)